MPRRTNAFQELVARIHAQMGAGWQVEESCFLRDAITGEPREVDVVAIATFANYALHISVECRDHRRPADVTWVEAMAQKHASLPTSKLALWSASGFTKAAISKATALKIETVSQAGAGDAPWGKIARSMINGSAKLVTPTFKPFVDVRDESAAALRIEDAGDTLLFDAQGNVAWSVHQILQLILNNPESRSVFLDNAPLGHADFYVEFIPPAPCFVSSPSGGHASVMRVGVGVSTFAEQLCLDTASAIRDGDIVSTMASADAKLGRFQIYVEETPDGPPLLDATMRKKDR